MSDPGLELCRKAKAGDLEAASELLNLHHERIYAYLRRLSRCQEDAEDLTQKTFSRIWRALPQFQGQSTLATWMHSIAYRVYVDHCRKLDRMDRPSDEWWRHCPSSAPGPFESVAEMDSAAQVYSLVEGLPEELRQVIHLRYYQGLAVEEVSAVLHVSTSTVKNRIRDALQLLQGRLADPPRRNL